MIEHDELCRLIPHAGAMCLLDRVLEWDDESILCQTSSHLNVHNPLRSKDGLSSLNAIEYGAQAMAIHGALLNRASAASMSQAYLAAVRDVEIKSAWLHEVDCPLTVQAQRLLGDNGSMIYLFSVHANDRLLVKGRAIVVAKVEQVV